MLSSQISTLQKFQSTQPKRAATLASGGIVLSFSIFQSTQPKRAATVDKNKNGEPDIFISIHAAQEGCDWRKRKAWAVYSISIHAAQEGCDRFGLLRMPANCRISIHAAQEGCDSICRRFLNFLKIFQSTQPKRAATCSVVCCNKFCAYFNPRSPRGLRQRQAA